MKKLQSFTAVAALALSLRASAFGKHYIQTNLVSSTSGVAPVTDPHLLNPWGLSRGSNGAWWVSDNVAGVSTLYNGAGVTNPLIVTIPPADPTNKKTPLGVLQVRSSTAAPPIFRLHPAFRHKFIFATNDGGIAAWNPRFANSDTLAAPAAPLYFTQQVNLNGIASGGLFGYLTANSIDLVEGNGQ